MPSVETVIAAIGLASVIAVVGGAAGTLRQFAHVHDARMRVSLRARYRRGRHHHPRTSILAAAFHGWHELAHAHALMTGGAQPW